MISWLIKKKIDNYEDYGKPSVQREYISLSGKIGLVLNLLMSISKMFIGWFNGSIAIVSDGANNLIDTFSSLITLVAGRISFSPADENHPFGHGRFEYIASLTVSFLILFTAFELAIASIKKIIHPEDVVISKIMLIIMILSILAKLWMYSYNMYMDKKIHSLLLQGVAKDSLNDVLISSGVILSLFLDQIIPFHIDGWISLVLAILIGYNGYGVMKNTVNILLGAQPSKDIVKKIDSILKSGKYVKGYHDLIIHEYGRGKIFASAHVEVPKNIQAEEIHEIIDGLEKKVRRETGVELSIHMDPTYELEEEYEDEIL